MSETVFLGLGTNLGQREENLQKAQEYLNEKLQVLAVSSILETPSWGIEGLPDYLNMVIEAKTNLFPLELIEELLSIEKKMGRIRLEKWHSRLIDIDILFYGSSYFKFPNLQVPHPYLQNREFVLKPLAEIAPNFIHPVLNKSVLELLKELTNAPA